MAELVCIKTCLNKAEADIIKGFLASHGITAILSADDCSGMRPDLSFLTGGTKILVKKEDTEKALSILENSPDE